MSAIANHGRASHPQHTSAKFIFILISGMWASPAKTRTGRAVWGWVGKSGMRSEEWGSQGERGEGRGDGQNNERHRRKCQAKAEFTAFLIWKQFEKRGECKWKDRKQEQWNYMRTEKEEIRMTIHCKCNEVGNKDPEDQYHLLSSS